MRPAIIWAWSALSIWQGPAMTVSTRSLPTVSPRMLTSFILVIPASSGGRLFPQDGCGQRQHEVNATEDQEGQERVFEGARIGRLVGRHGAHGRFKVSHLPVGLDPCGFELLERLTEHQLAVLQLGLGDAELARNLRQRCGLVASLRELRAQAADQ